jgi:Crinkler effector protein N-terminal domain
MIILEIMSEHHLMTFGDKIGLPLTSLCGALTWLIPSATMAAQQPANFTIFCVVVDKNCPCVVDISPHKTVAHLKEAIKLAESEYPV